ncbi:transglycosylase domain-containing protein [Microbacterium sp. RU33B]|uniref:transglycosylase domain-containing protein n=1 Tax=Microbacterium sp. RU33B TaxID=1907390 RepID=UPI0009615429|nr:transglycosylase domain-containing protein [Microbacterium sp. RU33B]SIT69609.1 Membrane carboxypeptidase (penicillin-binding protein) [Microbacterium sp. RU33B]
MPDTKRTATGVLGGLLGLVGLSVAAAVLVTATVTPAIAITGQAATGAISMFENLPEKLEIEKLMLPSTVYVPLNDGSGNYQEIATFYDQNRSPVTFDQIAPVMYDAILSSEDKNFYKHGGIDLVGTASALFDNLRGRDTRGGSSISQQYVKNVLVQSCESNAETDEEKVNCYTQATQSQGTEGIQRKLQEMRYAIALEESYSKNDILLGYLNIAGFGGLQYGVDAASRYYFGGTPASQLSIGQAATLAGMVQNPNTYRIDKPNGSWTDKDGVAHNSAADGYKDTLDRRNYVLARLLADGKITQEQYDVTLAEPITPVITPATNGCATAGAYNAAYFCQFVKNIILSDPAFGENAEERQKLLQRGGLNIYTTLDLRLQNEAQAAMADAAPTSVAGIQFGAAGVNLETSTGRVLAMVQNTLFSEEEAVTSVDPNYSSVVYAADKRYGGSGSGFNAGSTFKLFTLIDWLEKGHSLNEVVNGTTRGTIGTYNNSCYGSSQVTGQGDKKINNFGGGGGRVGTPMQFTASSLNTGFAAMAKQLDLCDISKVAARMGVTRGNGNPVEVTGAYSILGSEDVAPLAMAGAYATIANGGVYCQPKAIDRITDADGNELALPATTCTPVIEPNIAATAALALRGVMSGGTGSAANPNDRIPVIGKTGTHETWQTWMIETSTKVTSAVVVGTTKDEGNITRQYFNGRQLNQVRYLIAKRMQTAANNVYGGDRFPDADSNLLRSVLADLPDVLGKSVAEGQKILEDAGFEVIVGGEVDSSMGAGLIAAQNPPGGKAAGGTAVTINPSNGQGVGVPDVAGQTLSDAARTLNGAGFGNVQPGTCTVDAAAPGGGKVTGTTPAAGAMANRNAPVSLSYTRPSCP